LTRLHAGEIVRAMLLARANHRHVFSVVTGITCVALGLPALGCGGGREISEPPVGVDPTVPQDGGSNDDSSWDGATPEWDGAIPETTATGSVDGMPVSVNQAILGSGLLQTLVGYSVMVSSSPDNCGRDVRLGEPQLFISIGQWQNDPQAPLSTLAPLTIPVVTSEAAAPHDSEYVGLAFFQYGIASCQSAGPINAIGGSITVLAFSETQYVASFDLDFPSGHVSGSFATVSCTGSISAMCAQ
jgi:hypothetical protein